MTIVIETPTLVDVVCMALPRGERSAVTIDQLAAQLSTSRRQIEKALQAIADAGVQPLCAGDAGIWLAESAEELEAYVGRLTGRIRTQYIRVRVLRRLATHLPRRVELPEQRERPEQLEWLESEAVA